MKKFEIISDQGITQGPNLTLEEAEKMKKALELAEQQKELKPERKGDYRKFPNDNKLH